jgi:hypothetical protein
VEVTKMTILTTNNTTITIETMYGLDFITATILADKRIAQIKIQVNNTTKQVQNILVKYKCNTTQNELYSVDLNNLEQATKYNNYINEIYLAYIVNYK